MDFIHTKTGQAVNNPFKFELWSVANPISLQPSCRMRSLEQMWGRNRCDIAAGMEKYVLRDGTTYILKREGHRVLRFKVPMRLTPSTSVPEVDDLNLPDIIHV